MSSLAGRFRSIAVGTETTKAKRKEEKLNSFTHVKKLPMLPFLVAAVIAIIAGLPSQGLAQTRTTIPTMFSGIIDDFTPVLDGNGPWQVSGQWSLMLIGTSGRGSFSVGLNMVRADNLTRSPHTHQVTLTDAQVTVLANGFRLSGNAVITVNGNLAGFSGSPVDVEVTGGSTIPFTNIALTFGGGAVAHFGDQPFHGVVTQRQN
jgi:hypothetical protein